MSIDIFIALERDRLPTAEAWVDRIASEGFDVEMDRDFDPHSFSGYLPCPDESQGFEYSIGEIASELPALNPSPNQAHLLSGQDALVCLSSRSESDLLAAQAASASLALITDGFVIDGESGVVMTASEARAWALGDCIPARPSSPTMAPRPNSQWTVFRMVQVIIFVIILASLARKVMATEV